MSKVTVVENKRVVKETEYDYPVYLYFQDEDCNDELIMVTEKYQIRVKHDFLSLTIEKSEGFLLLEHYLNNNQTTNTHFLDVYNEAIKFISDSVNI
jgi:hypothetical protein